MFKERHKALVHSPERTAFSAGNGKNVQSFFDFLLSAAVVTEMEQL